MQPKLAIDEPGIRFEREADRVADQVMRMPEPVAGGGTPPMPQGCSKCQDEVPVGVVQRMCTQCEGELHRKPRHSETQTRDLSPRLETEIAAIEGEGQPLPRSVRAFFEPRFRHDFSDIRVHTSPAAAETASSINASAYTTGGHIVFASGRYAPETGPGRRLLAHELTHTIQQGHSTVSVQRRGDPTKVPPGLPCPVASDSPPNSIVEILFPNRGTVLTPGQKRSIGAFAVSWNASGAGTDVRVDGYASPPGTDELNWRLSCERAQAVAAELSIPSTPGIPAVPTSKLKVFAQGETGEFSRGGGTDPDGPNRRAAISSLPPPPPAPPPPRPSACPAVPTPTPATCPARSTAYCAARTCFPSTRWLPCVCTASGEVCDAVDAFTFTGPAGTALAACAAAPPTAPSGPIVAKGSWFLSTNRCIWGHWRAALDAIHDPTRAIPSGVTPEWSAAITTCRTAGVGSKDCCEAHVVAEQSAIDRCGPYNSAAFGRLPTDVPGAPLCSGIVAAVAPGPAFTGDFGNVADRISYGKSRCCP